MLNRLLLLFCCAMLTGTASAQYGYSGPDAIPWRTYKSDVRGRVLSPKQVVINNGASWQGYWREVTGQQAAQAPKNIDFSKEQVVGLHIGVRPTHGYEVYVESIRQTGPAETTVYYVEATPPPGRAYAQEQISPWTIVRMPRVPGVVYFSKRTVTGRPGIDWGDDACHCCCYCNHGTGRPVVVGTIWSGFPSFGGNPFDPLQNIQWRSYRQGNDSRFQKFETTVMENEASWQSYWQRNTGNPPQTAPKNVDWLKQRLIAVNVGKLPAGASVYVETVQRKNAANIEITYVVLSPEPPRGGGRDRDGDRGGRDNGGGYDRNSGGHSSQGVPPGAFSGQSAGSSPYAIISIDRVAGIFQFKRKDVTIPSAGAKPKCQCNCGSCKYGG